MNTVIGAAIATLIAVLTAALALLSGDGNEALQAYADFQAISTRRLVNKVTKSGDGGGTV